LIFLRHAVCSATRSKKKINDLAWHENFRTVLRSEGDPNLSGSLNILGDLLRATSRYGEAEMLYREALAIQRAVWPTGHPNIAVSLNKLAGLMRLTGRYGEAEALYREALEISQATLPDRHPDIATGLNNLALLLHNTGRYAEAEYHRSLR
jgi:tetratricopeptide (TPR) repeat protein